MATSTSTYSARYQQLREQFAYQRSIQNGGLAAALAPYSRLLPSPPSEPKVPTQRRRVLRQDVAA